MKIISILTFSILVLTSISGCQSMKDTFTLKKKGDVEQFLIKKKNPLVLPPEFEKLPNPKNEKEVIAIDDKIDLEKIMEGSKDSESNISESKDLEKSILNKVKKY